MKIINRELAKKSGLMYYFTGEPCIRNHVSKRFTRTKICVDCNIENARAWRKNNPGYGKENIIKWKQDNPERDKELKDRWRYNNKDFLAANVMLYQKRARQATPKWINRNEIVSLYANLPKGFHVDHIVPIKGLTPDGHKVSGLNVPWNLQYLPMLENYIKNNRMTRRCYKIACSLQKEIIC